MSEKRVRLATAFERALSTPVKQCRAVTVQIAPTGEEALLVAYSGAPNVDPWFKYMFLPTDTLKLAMIAVTGELLWQRDLGRGIVPGIWFFPFFPFDLDGDGVDEIWLVDNTDSVHPLNSSAYVLERVDPRTGEVTGQWPWPNGDMPARIPMSHAYRCFIFGGYVHGEPVLVTAQGTYGDMYLQGWSADMSRRWALDVPKEAPGARGSHRTPIVDWNHDGIDEVMWGERCIELDTGRELFCLDEETYRGHSDIVQPVYDWHGDSWWLYTVREGDTKVAPRVCCYNARGERIWGHQEEGHFHSGWVARMKEDYGFVAMAAPQWVKSPGVGAPRHDEEYYYDIATGQEYQQEISLLGTYPVDIDGDGYHEFAGGGKLITCGGEVLGALPGQMVLAGRFLPSPGEHVLTVDAQGVLRAYRDVAAEDTDPALARYRHPFYRANRRLTGCGYNRRNIGGV